MRDKDSLLDEGDGEDIPFPASPDQAENGHPHETKQVPKRAYNLSDKALAARRANAKKSTGPITADGKASSSRNSWKHGLHASATALGIVGKPCTSRCHKFPCTLVDDGATQPGRHCLDKEFFLDTLQKIELAILDGQLDGVNEIFGHSLASTVSILHDMQERILSDGTILKNAKLSKDGVLLGWDYVVHPALAVLPKLLASLNISFGDALLTPASIAKHKAEGDADKKMDVMGAMAAATNQLATIMAKKNKKNDG